MPDPSFVGESFSLEGVNEEGWWHVGGFFNGEVTREILWSMKDKKFIFPGHLELLTIGEARENNIEWSDIYDTLLKYVNSPIGRHYIILIEFWGSQ